MLDVSDLRPRSIARACTPHPVPGSISLTTIGAAYSVGPGEEREILIGRNRSEVHLCVGEDDLGVSRRHVVLRHRAGQWWVRREGRRDVQLGRGHRLWPDSDPVPLAPGYTSLVLEGSHGRIHVVEIAVADADGWKRPEPTDPTLTTERIALEPDERLALVALGERYLRDEPNARPRSWREAEARLQLVVPERRLGHKRIEHLVRDLRLRLSASGRAGLVEPDVESPGDMLKHNLLTLLIASNSIGPSDLALIESSD